MNTPKISIVVPNFNGAATLRQTLESVLAQDYPELELIVIDGGSTDGSVEIIRDLNSRISYWESEPDRGQSHAINKGLLRASGEVVTWLCSDDLLEPNALAHVAAAFTAEPNVDVVAGRCRWTYLDNRAPDHVESPTMKGIQLVPICGAVSQPSVFFKRHLITTRATPVCEDYHYALDTELWAYFNSRGARWKIIDAVLSTNQMSASNKTTTGGEKITAELERLYRTYCRERVSLAAWHRRVRHPLERIRKRHPYSYPLVRPLQMLITLALGPFYGFDRVRRFNWSGFI